MLHANLLCEVAKYLPNSAIYNLLLCTRSSIDVETIYMLKIKQHFPGFLDLFVSGSSGSSGRSGASSPESKDLKNLSMRSLYERLKYVQPSSFKIGENFNDSIRFFPESNPMNKMFPNFKISIMIRQLFMNIYSLGRLEIFKYFIRKYPYRHNKYYAHVIYDLSLFRDNSYKIFEYIKETDPDMFISLFGFRDHSSDGNFSWIYIRFAHYGGPITKIFEISKPEKFYLTDKSKSNDNSIINIVYHPSENGECINEDRICDLYLGPGKKVNHWFINTFENIEGFSKYIIHDTYSPGSPRGF